MLQLSDGAIQTSGASVRVKIGTGAWGAGAGTLDCDATSGIWTYTPTQAESNDAFFVVGVYKTGCSALSKTVITSASATAGYAGLDWSKITAPTTTVGLSGTSIKTATDVEADTLDIQSRIPTTLDNGLMRSSVESMSSNTITASVIATGAITASAIQTNAITDDKIASSAITEIQSGLATSIGVTAAFTEIKGAGWSSSTDTLEKIADAAGGGGTSIMVTPVVAQTPVRVVGSNISTFIGDLSTIRIGVFSGSDPVDLTAFGDLEVCVQQKNGTDLDFIEMADLTIDGDDDNYISWEPSGPSVADVTRGKWSLRKASNKQVIAYGAWIIEDAALEDVGS
jgi:hypothetical protein